MHQTAASGLFYGGIKHSAIKTLARTYQEFMKK
jgi:hypothetical protein